MANPSELSSAKAVDGDRRQPPSDEELADLREAFRLFDPGDEGFISPVKLFNCMRSFGFNPTEAEVQDMIMAVDLHGSGQISFDEFVQMMTPKMRSPASDDDLRQVFNALDVDRNGIVTDDDVRALFRRLGHEKNVKENLATMISASEIGSTDGISFPELRDFYRGSQH